MYILTEHARFVASDPAGNLIQIEYGHDAPSNLVNIDDRGIDFVIDAGPLNGFRVIHNKNSVFFMKDENFLCAEPNNARLIANRHIGSRWETFHLVSEYGAPRQFDLGASVDDEIVRFTQRVTALAAQNEPVKLHIGCGRDPRPGYLNLDIAVNAPEFRANNPYDYFIFPYANVAWGIPDDSVDYIFHEDFIEHIPQIQQIQFLAEARRVLRPGCYHRVNTPNLIASMRRHSEFSKGLEGVYTGELQWGHIAIFSPTALKEIAELVGYSEVVFTQKNRGVSPFFDYDMRPNSDRDEKDGNIFADLRK